jgi:hypothetical protein
VTKLLQCLRDELVRRDYAAPTIRSYVQIVEAFRQHTGARLDRLTPAQLRRYHLSLLEERQLAVGTVVRRFAPALTLSASTSIRKAACAAITRSNSSAWPSSHLALSDGSA